MRKLGLPVLAIAVTLLTLNLASAQDEIAATIQRTSTAPEIDGLGDDAAWQNATVHTLDEFFELEGDDPWEDEADLQVSWQALYDDDNLYVFIQVNDDEIVNEDSCNWEDDSIEIYLDAQNLDLEDFTPGGPEPDSPAFQLTAVAGDSAEAFCGELRIPEDSTSAFSWGINSYDASDPFDPEDDETAYPQGADTSVSALIDDNTYTLEVAFPWDALDDTPENIIDAGEMGFGIAINDDDLGGGRDTQFMWATEAGDLWMRSDTFPSVELESTPDVEGDFDGDGLLTGADIDLLSKEVVAGTNDAAFDLNADNVVNDADRTVWVEDLKKTWFGDSNFDGEFNSTDFVVVFTAGEYEDAVDGNSGWEQGDWNGDMDFNSSDFVTAFQGAGFEMGARPAVAVVPEPSSLSLLGIGLLFVLRRRRKD